MKTRNLIAIFVLTLNFSSFVAFAGNETSLPAEENLYPVYELLAPVSPVEATFEDGIAVYSADFSISRLAPLAPKEADFNDLVPETANAGVCLAPSTPREATFDDEYVSDSLLNAIAPATPSEATFTGDDDYINLAPVTPAEADFEEAI